MTGARSKILAQVGVKEECDLIVWHCEDPVEEKEIFRSV
jgi:hypothetical protein